MKIFRIPLHITHSCLLRTSHTRAPTTFIFGVSVVAEAAVNQSALEISRVELLLLLQLFFLTKHHLYHILLKKMAVQINIKATILGLLLLPITSLCFSRGPPASLVSISRSSRYRNTNALAMASREARLQGEYYLAKNGTSDLLMYHKTTVGSGLHTEDEHDDTNFLERELFEGYLSHQQLLLDATDDDDFAYVDESITFYEEPQVLTTSSYRTTASIASVRNNLPSLVLNDVWKARLLLLLSAALYGTNFSVVKQLDEIIPVGVASTLRFGFASFAMMPLLLAPMSDEFWSNIKNTASKTTYAFMEPSRLSVGLAGMEIGLWNSIGYISQAIGLRTTAASTVRKD